MTIKLRITMRRILPLLVGAATAAAQVPDSATVASMRWRAIGPVNMGARITDVEVDPKNTRIFYVQAATSGIWKTVNNGTSFFPVGDKLPIASMGDLAIAPSNTNVIYAGTGEEDSRNSASPGYGVYKSVDGGLTWKSVGLEKTQHIGRIVVDPRNPDVAYVAALGALWSSNPERGLYKTTDGGQTWTNTKFISDKAGFVDVAMDPRDPNTLYAASWERVRKVYTLKSGGPGSALWKSTDAGKTWREIKGGGFPETNKGRISLSISQSNPNVVYAQVEADSIRGAKPQRLLSGLYRSNDAGRTWAWQNTENYRPFYFSQIRVDPKNPDRVYRLAQGFDVSEDGGKTWRPIDLGIHEDYHAMWIDPADTDHFIFAGDAGIFQTYDRAGTYAALNKMPMAQFYNISFDYQVPYRVCGGMQDNGTSCGVSRRRGGSLQMTDWFAVSGADGFHTAQDPLDPNIVYYESQGGAIGRRNLLTGETGPGLTATRRYIWTYGRQMRAVRTDLSSPLTPDQERQIATIRDRMRAEMADPNVITRANWNTPFLISQHDNNVFYSGFDKVFKSVKKGASPFGISPDLSTKDPDRLRMAQAYDLDGNIAPDPSGGITNDADDWHAEQNGTVVSLGESPVRAGLLYAGTDDGNLWLTRNDGGSWENLTGRAPGVPAKTYVSRIEPSRFDSATVYVTFDNHRENDFKPYVYVSNDFGKTFRSISSDLPTTRPNYAYVIREDVASPNVLYLGTELGVYATIDRGAHWFKLDANLPVVPVYDLKVHPRDRELIAGTHGRAIQILDIAPLEQMADSVLRTPAFLFSPTTAFQYSQSPAPSELRDHGGWRPDPVPYGADISYRLASAGQAPARISILNSVGDTIARLTGPANAGINSVTWNYQMGTVALPAPGGRGRGAQGPAIDVPGFPPGYNPRPAESRQIDSTGMPGYQRGANAQGGRGGGGFGGGGGRGGNLTGTVPGGDYAVVLQANGVTMKKPLRVVDVTKAAPGSVVF